MKASQHLADGVTNNIWSTDATKQLAAVIKAEKVVRKSILQTVIALLAVAGKNGRIQGDYTKWKNIFQVNVAQNTISNVAATKPELFGTKLIEIIRSGHPNQVRYLHRFLCIIHEKKLRAMPSRNQYSYIFKFNTNLIFSLFESWTTNSALLTGGFPIRTGKTFLPQMMRECQNW